MSEFDDPPGKGHLSVTRPSQGHRSGGMGAAATPGKRTLAQDLPSAGSGPGSSASAHRWAVIATPTRLDLPVTEVGAVSPPSTATLTNEGDDPAGVTMDVVLYGGAAAPALPGEFELVDNQPRTLRPRESMTVEVVFRPQRVVPHIGARLRVRAQGHDDRTDVRLHAIPAPPRADHADQRELSIAEHEARRLEVAATPGVQRYSDMLAAVLAAQRLTDRAPHDASAHARVAQLLEPVARRLDQLNDHQGRLARFGAGHIAGQTALDMSQTAIRSWLQRLQLGARIDTSELVTRFRAGAEPIRFLTGERTDAPTLRAFDHASRLTAVGAAGLVLAPAVLALAVEEAALLAFVGRIASTRVTLWAMTHPAAALAASEALLGLGIQIGESGLGAFWDQLRDPRGRWFIVAQVLMDYMHVKSGMGHVGPADPPPRGPSAATGLDPAPGAAPETVPGPVGARVRLARLRAVVQAVHDGAADTGEVGAAARSPSAGLSPQSGQEPERSVRNSAPEGAPSLTRAAVRPATPMGPSDADSFLGKPLGVNKMSTGASDGIDPTPESIRQGTVRMEEHPDFSRVVGELDRKGYQVRYADGDPYVELVEVLKPDGTVVRYEKAVVVRKGMRFLDLEHELGHVEQAEHFKQRLVTRHVLEDGRPYRGPNRLNLLTTSLDAITEYHNRLVEFFRLRQRGVDAAILREHADGVRDARRIYWHKGMREGRSQSAKQFIRENLPDLPDLHNRFISEDGGR